MTEDGKSYEDGRRDGKIDALEDITGKHQRRLDSHSKRLGILERIVWGGVGIVALIKFYPDVQTFLQ